MTEEVVLETQKFMESINLEFFFFSYFVVLFVRLFVDYFCCLDYFSLCFRPWNTRVFKNGDVIEIKIASVEKRREEHVFNGKKYAICYGDFSDPLSKVVDNLKKALPYAANDNQKVFAYFMLEFG